jgi:hypothetical protein
LPSTKHKIVRIVVRVHSKKPKGQRGKIWREEHFPEYPYPIKRKKSKVQQRMEEDLERQIKEIEDKEKNKRD